MSTLIENVANTVNPSQDISITNNDCDDIIEEKEFQKLIFDEKIFRDNIEEVFQYIAKSMNTDNTLKVHGGFSSPKNYNPNNIHYAPNTIQNILKVLVRGFYHDEDSKSNEYTVEKINQITDHQSVILKKILAYNYKYSIIDNSNFIFHRHRYSDYQYIANSPVINATLNSIKIHDKWGFINNNIQVSGSIYISSLSENQKEKIIIDFTTGENNFTAYDGMIFTNDNIWTNGKLILKYYQNEESPNVILEYDIMHLSDKEKEQLRLLNFYTIP